MTTVNAGIEADLFAYICHSLQSTPYYKLLGIELQLIGPGYAEMSVKTGEEHTNPLGMIHGGLIMSVVDAAMGNAIRSLGIKGVTVDCSVALPGAAQLGDQILARGKVLKAGKNLIFAEASVYVNDKMIGDSKATFYNTGNIEFHLQEK